MKKNDLLQNGTSIIRVLSCNDTEALIIDCIKPQMPKWISLSELNDYTPCADECLLTATHTHLPSLDELTPKQQKAMHERFTLIASVLTFIENKEERTRWINMTAEKKKVSKQTIRKYLWLYLAYQNMTILAPTPKDSNKPLSSDEKNYRWALNRYYYTRYKNSLRTTYFYMLRDKYTNVNGELTENHPTYRQFQYFYSKTKKMQTYYISRDGLTQYQRNNRPLLGESVRDFAPNIGVGMVDSTILDIYLVNEANEVVGRPILTACVDAYSGLCCGYSLGWEGGMYSLRSLMLNVISDKVPHCKKFGISISKEEWDCDALPSTIITDMGSEYKSENFENLTELGVSIVNLNPYRPDLKSVVEKFFDVIQGLYKPHLRGKGVIEMDFQERGAHDYRKDACLTLEALEKVLIHCILYYNNHRIVSKEMFQQGVKPYASSLWEYGKKALGSNLITVDSKTLALCLLPRTNAKFSRKGLIVNKLRYKADGYTEQLLRGDKCVVAYNPYDVSRVWLIEDGRYTPFTLILSDYMGMSMDEVESIEKQKKSVIKAEEPNAITARISLIDKIETVASAAVKSNKNISSIRETRKRETKKKHIDYIGDNNNG